MTSLRSTPGTPVSLSGVKLKPAHANRSRERRDLEARAALVNRVRREFDDMPGLSISLRQASRLLGIPAEVCTRIFNRLVSDGLLAVAANGIYRRRSQV